MGLPETISSLLLAHSAAVEREGGRLGLVSEGDLEAVVPRHTADSLLFAWARRPRPAERWLDVGAGAGFPGLVLACCYPETTFVLAEPMRRRVGFLELVTSSLGLENVEVRPERIEQLEGTFDVVVARAFAEPSDALGRMVELVAPGGAAVVAAGSAAVLPRAATEVSLRLAGVDSPSRLFMVELPHRERQLW